MSWVVKWKWNQCRLLELRYSKLDICRTLTVWTFMACFNILHIPILSRTNRYSPFFYQIKRWGASNPLVNYFPKLFRVFMCVCVWRKWQVKYKNKQSTQQVQSSNGFNNIFLWRKRGTEKRRKWRVEQFRLFFELAIDRFKIDSIEHVYHLEIDSSHSIYRKIWLYFFLPSRDGMWFSR